MTANSEQDVVDLLKALPVNLPWQPGASFETSDEKLLLFDSACPGNELPTDVMTIRLPRRRQIVETALIEEDDLSLVLHRFKVV